MLVFHKICLLVDNAQDLKTILSVALAITKSLKPNRYILYTSNVHPTYVHVCSIVVLLFFSCILYSVIYQGLYIYIYDRIRNVLMDVP